MKSFEKLIKKFNRLNPDYIAELDKTDSCRGCYKVYISYRTVTSTYYFVSCRDFISWMNGVVLD